MTYIGEDAVTLLTNAALETEGQVVAADHNSSAKTLLEWLHVWLDAWEVQPLDIGQEGRRREEEEVGGMEAGDKTTRRKKKDWSSGEERDRAGGCVKEKEEETV